MELDYIVTFIIFCFYKIFHSYFSFSFQLSGIVGDTEKVISGETKNQQQHAIETLDSNPSDNSNTQNEDFDSKNDIFKTTNFMVKGFQSTRISNDESHKQEVPVAIKSTLVETDEETIRRHEETMRRHSTPDNLEKNSSAADNTASLSGGKPLNSSIRKDNRSADSSNILSGPYDSEERHSASKKEETAMGGDLKRGDFEQTFSEGKVFIPFIFHSPSHVLEYFFVSFPI